MPYIFTIDYDCDFIQLTCTCVWLQTRTVMCSLQDIQVRCTGVLRRHYTFYNPRVLFSLSLLAIKVQLDIKCQLHMNIMYCIVLYIKPMIQSINQQSASARRISTNISTNICSITARSSPFGQPSQFIPRQRRQSRLYTQYPLLRLTRT